MSEVSDIKDIELSVVVPVFEEEDGIRPFLDRLLPVLRENTASYEVIFVLDPGRDKTEQVIHDLIQEEPAIEMLVMTRRWGQAACTLAGIDHCRGKACVVIDVDLQDPPELIVEFVAKWREGYDVVLAQRRSRKGETIPKRITAALGYWVINHISDVSIPPNSGDFRLMSRRVVDALGTLKETHGFLRGLVGYVGFRQTVVRYDRDERTEGRSKYSQITGSLRIGLNGIVAFSLKPLELATALGFIMAIVSFIIGIYYVLQKLFWNTDITPGLASTILMISFFAGVQLICLGIMGEYIGRIYDEVRDRPKYMIDRRFNRDGEQTY